jgi:AcrR family transcriptional regulator
LVALFLTARYTIDIERVSLFQSERKEEIMASPGRPRSFDKQKALDAALQVFWRKGYEGATLTDLTSAMGIEKPSLYAAFGDKEALFRKVLDHYQTGPANMMFAALQEPTARRMIERLLRQSAVAGSNPRTPRGCLYVQGALACGSDSDCVRTELISRRAAGEAALRKRLQRAKKEGDLPKSTDPAGLARYIMAVLHGMSVRSTSGASRKELRGIAEMALRAIDV